VVNSNIRDIDMGKPTQDKSWRPTTAERFTISPAGPVSLVYWHTKVEVEAIPNSPEQHWYTAEQVGRVTEL